MLLWAKSTTSSAGRSIFLDGTRDNRRLTRRYVDAVIIGTCFTLGMLAAGSFSTVWGQAKTSRNKPAQSSPTQTSNSNNPAPPASNSPSTIAGFEGQLVADVDSSKPDTGDYIPCEFTVGQLLSLRPRPVALIFGPYESEKLRATVIAEAVALKSGSEFSDDARQYFIWSVSKDTFEGLTPSQALARVIYYLAAAVSYGEAVQKHPELRITVTGFFLSGTSSQLPIQPPDNKASLPEASQTAAIVESARGQISAFQRPTDIGCAMSIYEWNDMRYQFGQTIADEYIGVQIVVRNLNADKEFLIHDAEISVDSDLNGSIGRFYSGQDKLAVRGFMLASRDYGRRNFMVHLAQGVGSVMSASSLVFGPALQAATNVYNAGFITALQNVWTDHNTDQLNLLNDLGFSASKTERTVVPKSGTAMFVIFIPSKPFQSGWWTQPCANSIVLNPAKTQNGLSSSTKSGPTPIVGGGSLQSGIDLDSLRAVCQNELGNGVKSAPNTASSVTPSSAGESSNSSGDSTVKYISNPKQVPYGKWTSTATAIFRELTLAVVAGTHLTEETQETPSIANISCPTDQKGDLDFSKANGGILTCDLTGQSLDKAQSVKLHNAKNAADTKTADGSVATSGDSTKATVKFELDQLGALEAPTYQVYPVTSAGAEGSPASQTLRLSLEPFISDAPSPDTLNLTELTKTGASAQTVMLKGYHLDTVASVHLGNNADKVTADDSISIDSPVKGTPSATSVSFEVTSTQASKLKAGDKPYIFVVSKDKPGTDVPTGQALSVTGSVQPLAKLLAAPANKKPTAKPSAQKK